MSPEALKKWLADPNRQCLVMGVLNVTPDSFSDGGKYASVEAAVGHAIEMAEQGAEIIDIGAESTRPGAQRVDVEEQLRRVVPVLEALKGRLPAVVSIDTTRAEVARAALGHGAAIINDISGGEDDAEMLPLAGRSGAALILMHKKGQPATMQADPTYTDVTLEVGDYLRSRARAAQEAGVSRSDILVDPGIGFGKTAAHNLKLLRRQRELAGLGYPLVIGTSRKRFIGAITGETEPAGRVLGTAATVAWSIANGAAIVRVHDVEPMVRVVRMVRAILNSGQ